MLPKAELHVHLECTITPSRARQLAERHGVPLPEAAIGPNDTWRFSSFPEFLGLTDQVAACLRSPEDYFEITLDYLKAAKAAGVIYQELIFWHALAERNGLGADAAFAAVAAAATDSAAAGGPLCIFQTVLVRHDGPEACEAAVEWTRALGHPLLRGVNLAGNEISHPPGLFQRAFAMAAEAGLGAVVHAGEALGPESVRAALQLPGVRRIGHGVRAIEDADLVAELAERGITLEVCPGSNVALGFYPDFAAHPLRRLHEAGVRVTLNADDPPFFATSIAREYDIAARDFGMDEAVLIGLTRNAIEAGFLAAEDREGLLAGLL